MLNELMNERIKEERIMKNVMKTALRNTKLVMILAFLPALLSAAQAQAVTYKGQSDKVQSTMYQVQRSSSFGGTMAPSASFHSTSAYSGQWEEQGSMTPMLNSDGTVNTDAYGVGQNASSVHHGHIRKINNPEDDVENPLGDAVLPLMALLCAYAIYKKVRARSRSANGSQEN